MANQKVIQLTADSFAAEVLEAPGAALVDFWAAWCAPCRLLAPVIDDLAETATGAKICKLDVDVYGPLAAQYGVMGIPTVIIFRDGKETQRFVGVQTKEILLQALAGDS